MSVWPHITLKNNWYFSITSLPVRRYDDKGERAEGFGTEELAHTSQAIDQPRHVALLQRGQEHGPRPRANATWGATLPLGGWELAKSEQSGVSSSGMSLLPAVCNGNGLQLLKALTGVIHRGSTGPKPCCEWELDWMTSQGPFQHKLFYDL